MMARTEGSASHGADPVTCGPLPNTIWPTVPVSWPACGR